MTLFHATLLELALIYKNPEKLFTKKLSVIPTSLDLIMIVVLVVELAVLDAAEQLNSH